MRRRSEERRPRRDWACGGLTELFIRAGLRGMSRVVARTAVGRGREEGGAAGGGGRWLGLGRPRGSTKNHRARGRKKMNLSRRDRGCWILI